MCSNPVGHRSQTSDFLDLGCLALTITQIIQLGAANLTVTDHFYVINTGGIDRERAFNTNPVGHPANSEGLADATVTLGDNSAFESLQTFAVSFHNLYPNADSVADVEGRKIAANLLRFDGTNNLIHDVCLLPL